jgi:hypothetical protein
MLSANGGPRRKPRQNKRRRYAADYGALTGLLCEPRHNTDVSLF